MGLLVSQTSNKYRNILMAGHQVFDHILTLPNEIILVWRAPWSIGKILYLITKYLVIVEMILNLICRNISIYLAFLINNSTVHLAPISHPKRCAIIFTLSNGNLYFLSTRRTSAYSYSALNAFGIFIAESQWGPI